MGWDGVGVAWMVSWGGVDGELGGGREMEGLIHDEFMSGGGSFPTRCFSGSCHRMLR